MPLIAKSFSNLITFTRASTATYFAANGILTTAATNEVRFDYDPSTYIGRGILIEESRTNSIRNNTMVGAVAGTPGTLPTNWAFTSGSGNGITRTIVGTGTENGITYIDLQYTGTAIGAGNINIVAEPNNQVAAVQNQVWTFTCYAKLVAGSFANTTARTLFINSYTAAGAFDANASSPNSNFPVGGPTSAALNTQRYFYTGTLASATTAFVNCGVFITYNAGAVIDFTIRIGLPQLEQGAFATSVIPTTTTALTRSADVASVNTLAPWFNAVEGTTYFEGVTFDSTAGSFPRAFQFNDGTNSNVIQVTRNPSSAKARMSVVVGGVAQAADDATTWTLNTNTKVALAYAVNDFAIVANGGAATTDTSGTLPTVTSLLLGSQSGTVSFLNGYLRRITYYPRRLANADLQSLTV